VARFRGRSTAWRGHGHGARRHRDAGKQTWKRPRALFAWRWCVHAGCDADGRVLGLQAPLPVPPTPPPQFVVDIDINHSSQKHIL
jgi:hypothetical protein